MLNQFSNVSKLMMGCALGLGCLLISGSSSNAANVYSQSKYPMKIFVYTDCSDKLNDVKTQAQLASSADPILQQLIGAFTDFGGTQLKRLQEALAKNGCKPLVEDDYNPTTGYEFPANKNAVAAPQKGKIPNNSIILAYKTSLGQSSKPVLCKAAPGNLYLYTLKSSALKKITSASVISVKPFYKLPAKEIASAQHY